MQWTKTIDGVEVTFYRETLQQSLVFPKPYLAYWTVNGASFLEPQYYATEPSDADVEALY